MHAPPGAAVEGIPEEAAIVGPGTPTEGVRMNVFQQNVVLDTRAQQKRFLRDLVDEAKRDFERIIEGPTAFVGPGFRAVYISVVTRSETGKKVILQEGFIYTGKLEYRFICQFAAGEGRAIDRGCKQALRTLEIEGVGEVASP